MWQYTTETIINSNKGNLEGGVRFAVYNNQGKEATGIPSTGPNTNRFIIDGVNAFVAKNITAVYKTEYKDEVQEVAEITVPATGYAAGDTLRLKVVLRQEGLVSSIYQNAYLKHKKPLFFEIAAVAGAKDNAEALVKVIKQQLGVSDFKFFTASAAGAVITLTAADCYARFVEISLDKVGAAEGSGEALLGFEDYVNVAKGEVTTSGSEGMGTVRQLIKNLRLPTSAATNPFGADQGGKPIPGGKYTQYLIEYTTDRRHVGGQVMGALDQSITSHVFFIESAIVDTFNAALKLVATVTDVEINPEDTDRVAKAEIGSVE